MTHEVKSAYELMMEFPESLSLDPRKNNNLLCVRSIIGSNDINFVCDENVDFETRSVMLDISQEASAVLEKISQARINEYNSASANGSRLPLVLQSVNSLDYGIRAELLSNDCEDSRICISADDQSFEPEDVNSLEGFSIELNEIGTFRLMAEEPYGVYVSFEITHDMLQQMAMYKHEHKNEDFQSDSDDILEESDGPRP